LLRFVGSTIFVASPCSVPSCERIFVPIADVDVLAEFESGFVPGLEFFSLEEELSRILGRKVDLNTPSFLGKYFREQVLADAEIHYVAA